MLHRDDGTDIAEAPETARRGARQPHDPEVKGGQRLVRFARRAELDELMDVPEDCV